MARCARLAFVVVGAWILTAAAAAQTRDPISPGVGRAVLLATRSIQVDRDTAVVSGDLIVNDASPGPYLGEAQLALDRGVTTPAGSRLMANGIDIDQLAVIGGDVYSNTLVNAGTITGTTHNPLALPVFARLPEVAALSPGHDIVSVPANTTVDVEPGDYTLLSIGVNGTARLLGEGYTFTSINASDGATLRCVTDCDVHVRTQVTSGVNFTIAGVDPSRVLLEVVGNVTIGRAANIGANIYAPNGQISLDRDAAATGAFFAHDIHIGRNAHLTLASATDRPPRADAQSVFTDGATPVAIALSGSDPEGGALTFAIVSGPAQGSLSPLAGNLTTYTPATGANLEDAFTFRVTDPAGNSGTAVVSINPPREEPPPPDPSTVIAEDLEAPVTQNDPETLVLSGFAPFGVTLTFTIEPGTGPFHGSLGSIVHGTQDTVVYTPDLDYTGPDSFDFKACGVVSSTTVCDTATYHLNVLEYRIELPDLAHDVTVSTFVDQQILIALGLDSVESLRTFIIRPNAAFLDPVEVAGLVADSNSDGIGDNHMVLPASVPVFMSAGVGQSGGPGSNGTVRMEFEWDVTGFGGSAGNLRSASVLLHTHRGTVDSLNTNFFHMQSTNDGLLTDADYAGPGERIRGALMDVPASMAVGDEGTFQFSVFGELKAAIEQGLSFFTVQGRVDEGTAGPARGLEVRTSVTTNQTLDLDPKLSLTTPGVAVPLEYTVLSLPAHGTLYDNTTPITSAPYVLSSSQVLFQPDTGFAGDTSFQFQVQSGLTVDTALATIRVITADCATNPAGCNNGR